MKIGDRVRVVKIPSGLQEGELKTRTVFRKCIGRIFKVEGFQHELIELNVGRAVGKASYMETIWIEPEFLEKVTSRTASRKKGRLEAAARPHKSKGPHTKTG
jgi:hypothetical protein